MLILTKTLKLIQALLQSMSLPDRPEQTTPPTDFLSSVFLCYLAFVHIVVSAPTSPPEVTETKSGADGRDTDEPLSYWLQFSPNTRDRL